MITTSSPTKAAKAAIAAEEGGESGAAAALDLITKNRRCALCCQKSLYDIDGFKDR